MPAVLDIRRIRTDPDEVKAALARRGIDVADVDRVHDLDARRRELAAERDEVRNHVKTVSKEVGRLRAAGDVAAAEAQQAESRALGERERALADDEAAVAEDIRQLLLRIPNTPHPDAPDGASDADNPVVKVVGFDPESYQPHQRVPHWETGAALGILDNERAVKITGSMFVMLRKQGATLSRALCQLALDNNADAFEEIRPPSLVSSATLTATGQLPKFADDAYAIERDDLWCIPTAEVPLTSIASGELLDEADLPQRFMALLAVLPPRGRLGGPRHPRHAARARVRQGRDPGLRHARARRPALLDELVARAEATIASLGLAYRIIEICTGDLGQSHHRVVRHRGLRARLRPVARGLVDLLVQRLPGPPGRHPLPPDAGRRRGPPPQRVHPHPQRLGAGRAPGLGGHRRDPPQPRRHRHRPRAAAPLPPRRHRHLLTPPLGQPAVSRMFCERGRIATTSTEHLQRGGVRGTGGWPGGRRRG